MMKYLIFLGAASLALPGCTTADKIDLASAYESCAERTGDARERCIKMERSRFRLERAERNERCLDEIQRQAERGKMIDGEMAPDPQSEAARFDAC